MPKSVNPFIQVSKRLASLQAKSSKLHEEIGALAKLVETESKKQAELAAAAEAKAPAKAAPSKAAPAKVPAAKASPKPAPKPAQKPVEKPAQEASPKAAAGSSKKRGRPARK